ncbi:division plane positioning ATPase MipZ [Granulosicoccaceae sp. 1_MG-2023]|nr:division plane positioning ATPase MipZ [Granulosicoccaceae sp. 1_MG-2023]
MPSAQNNAHIIVFGNEKGGTGKSTTAMHVVVALLYQGRRVAVMDLDSRQQTLKRYCDNRRRYCERHAVVLPEPTAETLAASDAADLNARDSDEKARLGERLKALAAGHDFLIVDCPGNDTNMARLAHSIADTLVTPLNDSFVDLDLIGEVDEQDFRVQRLSHYSETVWESRKQRTLYGKRALDWVVMRNRIGQLNSRNMQRVHAAITELQKRVAFRYVAGLSERVIYRELFPKGLTLLDTEALQKVEATAVSHVAARFEVRQIIEALNLPGGAGQAAG